ncbi:MAG: molybdopterin oxidoreductase, partial [Pseudobdellovibrionaceae bacterium]
PEEITLGVANNYTSSYFDGSEGLGILIKTREGRPVKIEANPSHPFNQGGLSVRSQASLLSLYDPERLQGPKRNLFNEKKSNYQTVDVKWEDLDNKVVDQLKKGKVVVLTGSLSSPSTRAVVGDFAQAFGAKHVVWEPLTHEEVRNGQKAAYGDETIPQYRFDLAKVIVSVDADFLGTWLTPTAFTKQFSLGRKDIKEMNRLVSFDSSYSLTASNADIRFKIKPSQQLAVVLGLLHEIIVKKGQSSYAGSASVKSLLESAANVPAQLGLDPVLFAKVAADLWQNRGKSLVVAGGLATQTSVATELQVAVNFLNSILENDGKSVQARQANPGLQASAADLLNLVDDLKNGKVETLIIHRVNPGYTLPESVGFADAIKKAKMVIYTGDRIDETGVFADYLATDNHALETWGDTELTRGVFTVSQPAIRSLYDTRSFQLSLMTWAYLANQGPKRLITYETFYDYLRNFWKEEIFPAHGKGLKFEDFWLKALQEGAVGSLPTSTSARSFKLDSLAAVTAASKKVSSAELELVLYPTVALGDGTLANVSWLQELPDPVTKIVWDNYASVSLATAEKLHLKESSVVTVKVGEVSLELPVHIQPGLHDGVVAVAVGYGRTRAGKVANGIGQNAYRFLQSQKGQLVASGEAVTLTKLNKKYELACTQGHHSMEGRQIVVEASNKDYAKDPGANIHRHHTWSIWSGHKYNGHKWGMALDLHSCTGCSACVTACQSENNVPVVGKKYVLEGREMHWIRVDRYYTGTPDAPETVFQPVMCQHC